MGIYVHTVLKSKPLKVCIPIETAQGIIFPEVKIYRVKWHGKEYYFDYDNDPLPFQSKYDDTHFDYLSRRAEQAWKGDRPSYIICTGANYDGKIDWDDEYYKDGYPVYRSDKIAFLENEAYHEPLGKLIKVGRGKYKFIPKVI